MSEKNFIDTAKVFGKGKIVVPKRVKQVLEVKDEDYLNFYQDEHGRIFLEKAPTLKREHLGKYK